MIFSSLCFRCCAEVANAFLPYTFKYLLINWWNAYIAGPLINYWKELMKCIEWFHACMRKSFITLSLAWPLGHWDGFYHTFIEGNERIYNWALQKVNQPETKVAKTRKQNPLLKRGFNCSNQEKMVFKKLFNYMHSKRGIKYCTQYWENTSLYSRLESHICIGFLNKIRNFSLIKRKKTNAQWIQIPWESE